MPLDMEQVLEDRYRIEELLGQGGMGAVYRATDLRFDGPVALKENRLATPAAQKQFVREARLLFGLRHPNLPRVTDQFAVPDQGQYLVMDFIAGTDLTQVLEHEGALPTYRALAWIDQVLDALAYLHDQEIIHRDVKPANVRITLDDQVFLVDFGLAKIYNPLDETTVGARGVTRGYAPPEQYGHGRTDARTDVYAAGATLYTMLTGQSPPDALDVMIRREMLEAPRQINLAIPPEVEVAVLQAMQSAPDDRLQSAADLRAALLELSDFDGAAGHVPEPPGPARAEQPGPENEAHTRLHPRPDGEAQPPVEEQAATAGDVAPTRLHPRPQPEAPQPIAAPAKAAEAAGPGSERDFEPLAVPLAPDAITSRNAKKVTLLLRAGHGPTRSLAYSPDGRWLTAAARFSLSVFESRSLSRKWLREVEARLGAVSFSPQGMLLATGAWDGSAMLWDAKDGRPVLSLRGHNDSVSSLAFAPDGEFLASGSDDATVRLWRVRDGSLVRVLAGHAKRVRCVAFSPDGGMLATGSYDQTVRLWSASNGRQIESLEGHDRAVTTVAFSPNGEILAAGNADLNGTVLLRRIPSGRIVHSLRGHERGITCVAFSPDGELLASASLDDTIRLWRASDGQLLNTLKGHGHWVLAVAFSPDGRRLASGSYDGTVRLWGLPE